MQLGNPVDILNALGFGCMYVAIVLMVHYAGEYAGNKGLLVSGFLSGFADVDAITIAMSKLNMTQNANLPILVIVIAMISNTVVKICIAAIKGAPELRPRVGAALGTIIAAGILYIWIFRRPTYHQFPSSRSVPSNKYSPRCLVIVR
jgi:uncharacterized membrane protein (DUF4010 family)